MIVKHLKTTTALAMGALLLGAGNLIAEQNRQTGQAAQMPSCAYGTGVDCRPVSEADIRAAAIAIAAHTDRPAADLERGLRSAVERNRNAGLLAAEPPVLLAQVGGAQTVVEETVEEAGEQAGEAVGGAQATQEQAEQPSEPAAEQPAQEQAEDAGESVAEPAAEATQEVQPAETEQAGGDEQQAEQPAAEAAQEATEEAAEEAAPAEEQPATDQAAEEAVSDPAPEGQAGGTETGQGQTGVGQANQEQQGETASQPETQADGQADTDGQTTVGEGDPAEDGQTAEQPQQTAEDEARAQRRAERRARRQQERLDAEALESTDDDADAASAETETEIVTQANSRSSSEESGDDDGDEVLGAILGFAAGVAVGAILENGDRVVERRGDRVIVERDGRLFVLKDENELLRRPGTEVRTRRFADGSTRTVVIRPNGARIVTVRAADGAILYRSRIRPNGREIVLIDERRAVYEPVIIAELPPRRREYYIEYEDADPQIIYDTFTQQPVEIDRRYSLQQVREVHELRELMPRIDLDTITFETGSAAIGPDQARKLSALGSAMADLIADNPGEMFLIEGHTDTVGSDLANLALSDRRAESVALALTEYFDVPPENMVTQGYGERHLKVAREGDVRANRRAAIRRITPLLGSAEAR